MAKKHCVRIQLLEFDTVTSEKRVVRGDVTPWTTQEGEKDKTVEMEFERLCNEAEIEGYEWS